MEEGTLIYCRVLKIEKYAKTQLTCISLIHKKAWNSGEAFFGPLVGGFVKDFPISFCRRILNQSESNDGILERLGELFKYDINIGFNGRVWVKTEGPDTINTIFIMNALEKVVEFGFTKENIDFIMKTLKQK